MTVWCIFLAYKEHKYTPGIHQFLDCYVDLFIPGVHLKYTFRVFSLKTRYKTGIYLIDVFKFEILQSILQQHRFWIARVFNVHRSTWLSR